ncbi:MAG: CHAT domain-containing tetratricopeptide repeat protein [Oceanicaulis sp.]
MFRIAMAAALAALWSMGAQAQDAEPQAPPEPAIAEAVTDEAARALLTMAQATDMEAEPQAALDAWTAAFEAARAAAPDETIALAQIRNQLGAAHFYAGAPETALGHFQAAAAAFEGVDAYAENRQEALGNVGSILSQLGRFEEAEAAQREALEVRRTLYPEAHPQIARSYFELGALADDQGRAGEAARLVRRALELRLEVLGPDHPHVAMTQVSLASILSGAQRHDEAIEEARGGLELLERIVPEGHPFISFARSNYAGALNAAGRHREAEPFLREILDARRAQLGSDHPQVADSLNNLAVALGALGRDDEARTLFLAARGIYLAAEGEDSPTAARMQANGADFAGEAQLSERLAALEAFDRIGVTGGENRMRLLARLAISLAGDGQLDAAQARIGEARALAANLFAQGHEARLALAVDEAWISAADPARLDAALALAEPAARTLIETNLLDVDRSRDAAVRRDAARRRALDVAYAAGDRDLVIALLDAGGPGGLSLSLGAAAARSGDTAEALRERQDAARSARAAETRYVRLRASAADPDALRAASQGLETARAELVAADASLPEAMEALEVRPGLADVQAGLAPHEAVLAFAFTERGGVVAAINQGGLVLDRLAISQGDAVEAVAALRAALSAGAGAYRSGPSSAADGLSVFPADAAYRLYQGVFTPSIEAVAGGARTLVVQPDGPYASLPFSVLITEPGPETLSGARALRQAAWLARRQSTVQAIGLAPRGAEARRTRTRPARLFAAGAPAFSGGGETLELAAVLRGARADSEALSALPRLPGAQAELDRLAASFGAERTTVVAGASATEDAVLRGGLEQADILVFATHGLLPGELEGLDEPALAFLPPGEGVEGADGLLTASEIAALRLTADWVVLSACNTFADGRATPADRLAEAFLYAGARSLLVSHWAVRDDVAAEITIAVATGAPALGRAEAHRQAMLAVLDDPSIRGGAHPGVWAPFAIIGR